MSSYSQYLVEKIHVLTALFLHYGSLYLINLSVACDEYTKIDRLRYVNLNILMMAYKVTLLLLISVWMVAGQRPSFAGSKPIGFPDVSTPNSQLGNRFGDEQTERLPVEAKGDRALVERLSKLPIDNQPFWLINWRALEESRKNPQTYPQRESSFSGSSQNTDTSAGQNSQLNSGPESNSLTSKFGTSNAGSATIINENKQNQSRRQSRRLYA